MNVWIEELKADYFRVCLREVKTFDGKHQNLKVASLTRIVLLYRNICRNVLVLFMEWFSPYKCWRNTNQELLAWLWDKCVKPSNFCPPEQEQFSTFERLFSAELFKTDCPFTPRTGWHLHTVAFNSPFKENCCLKMAELLRHKTILPFARWVKGPFSVG